MLSEDIKRFLPQYLSTASSKELFEQLDSFPTDGTKDTIYSTACRDDFHLFQGDGIANVLYADFPDPMQKEVNVILLSNTCDMSLDNSRLNPCRIMYCPILNYDKYADAIRKAFPDKAESHLDALRKQYITQAMYLPKGDGLKYDAIIFFDRAISLPLKRETVQKMISDRLFILSNFGFYLFLLKLSIHFMRIQERLDRNTGVDLGAIALPKIL